MSEGDSSFSADQGSAPDIVAPISGGAMLRSAREAQGLHIAALAVSLKVPVKKLEALETDRFDLLPDIVFVRALASSICRTLKIDPDPILASLPHSAAPRLKTSEPGINVPFRVSPGGVGLSLKDQLAKPVVLAVLVLLVGALVLIFFPFAPRTDPVAVAEPETPAVIFPPAVAVPQASDKPVSLEVVAPVQASRVEEAGSDVLRPVIPVAVTAPASLPTQAASAPSMPGSVSTTGIVVIKARGPSWVEVVDANRTIQVRKTLIAGEVVGASGVLPLSVVVGRADATEVQVRDAPFDLTRLAKDNVARFEVK